MGHADAFRVEDFRHMLTNACYWCMGLEDQFDPRSDVAMTGDFMPGPAGSKGLKLGVKPDDASFAARVVPARSVAGFLVDDKQRGWSSLTAEDLAKVNIADDTWSGNDCVLHCTGQQVSVVRTKKQFRNFELAGGWTHEKPAGNSGVFDWVTPNHSSD